MKNDVIIVTMCKNESDYIEEFIDYHLNLGFDKIIIGDNNDINGELYNEQLKYYIKNKKVKIINIRGKKAYQMQFYNWCKENINYEWCAFIDIDEFITFNPDCKFTNIKDFLNSNTEIRAYKLSWMCYGDNGKIEMTDENVVDRFPTPMPYDFKFSYDFPENYHVKMIIKKDVIQKFKWNPHYLPDFKEYYRPNGDKGSDAPFDTMEYSTLYVRHYFTKSLEDWIRHKMGRGNVLNPQKDEDTYTLDLYFRYNDKTPEKIKFLKDNGINYE